jgi:hypothetical protein
MPTDRCRQCREPVTADLLDCPECGAPRPALSEFLGDGYEWKTAATWMDAPLVHIAFGIDASGRVRTARGIVAIGQRAVGVFAFGIIAVGGVTVGIISLGFVSLGLVAIALFAALGMNAVAPLAYGVVAMGYAAGGLAPIGWKFFSLDGSGFGAIFSSIFGARVRG